MRLSFTLALSIFLVFTDAFSVAPRADVDAKPIEQSSQHWKRRGGGGGGGGRGGSGSSGGSSGSSGGRGSTTSSGGSSGTSGSSGSSGGSSSSSGGGGRSGSTYGSSSSSPSSSGGRTSGGRSGYSSGRGSSTSTSGGRTTTGSGPAPAYGGGKYYGGGAAVPYKSGQRSPSGINPLFVGAGLGMLAFWPGVWLYGAYTYHYSNPYHYYNRTSKANETAEVTCGCDPFAVCGCDENGDQQFLSDIIGNGTDLNNTLVSVATINNTRTILLNGTLPNGTTASGGDEDPFDNASAGMRRLLENAGFWPVVALVATMVFAA